MNNLQKILKDLDNITQAVEDVIKKYELWDISKTDTSDEEYEKYLSPNLIVNKKRRKTDDKI